VSKESLFVTDNKKRTLLHRAAKAHQLELVEEILECSEKYPDKQKEFINA